MLPVPWTFPWLCYVQCLGQIAFLLEKSGLFPKDVKPHHFFFWAIVVKRSKGKGIWFCFFLNVCILPILIFNPVAKYILAITAPTSCPPQGSTGSNPSPPWRTQSPRAHTVAEAVRDFPSSAWEHFYYWNLSSVKNQFSCTHLNTINNDYLLISGCLIWAVRGEKE